MDIIAACIESGCYSAVFAIMLVFAVRTHIKREEYYRRMTLSMCMCDWMR